MALPITYLFVPGNRPDRFEKALSSGADAVILDLEDAVAAAEKDAARAAIAAWFGAGRTARGVRAVEEIAAADAVQRLAFGTLDFTVDLDLSGDERGLLCPATMIAFA